MSNALPKYDRYYLSYSSPTLPLKLVSPLSLEDITNRNTFFGANLDEQGRICLIHQLVYGHIELCHQYGYDKDGQLSWAEISNTDDEVRKLWFNPEGQVIRQEEIS